MGKKTQTYEEVKEQLDSLKQSQKEVRDELKAFLKENKIKRGTPVEEVKTKATAKAYKKLLGTIESNASTIEELKEQAKTLKPAKVRQSKYDYPEGVETAADKKKYRAEQRRKAKAAEKAAAGEGEEETKKASKKSGKKAGKKSGKKAKAEASTEEAED